MAGKTAPKKEAPKEAASGLEEQDDEKVVHLPEKDAKKAESERKPVEEQKPVKAAELRTAYENLKAKVAKEYEPALKRLPELEAKLKELESRDETAGSATQERIAAIEKRNAELERHIKVVDYEKSTEFVDKFQKPEEEAWGNALRELKGLTMTITDPQTQEESTREITQADIAYLANLDPAVARKEINRLFPDDKEEVKRHVNQITYLAQKSQQAREKAKADAETHSKTVAEQQQQSQRARAKFWKESNESLAQKYPEWFAPAENDQEGNALFERGTALADLAFNPADITPERVELLPKMFREQIQSGKPFTQPQLVQLHAIVRAKASNHDRAIRQVSTLKARVAELETSLKEYEASGPDGVKAGESRVPPNGIPDAGEELDALARKH